MKKTKYLNQTFGDWVCTHVGIARVQGKKTRNKTVSKQPGRQTYYYIFERQTSDGKAEKLVRLSAAQAAKVYRGEITVEEIANQRQQHGEQKFIKKVSYHFYNN